MGRRKEYWQIMQADKVKFDSKYSYKILISRLFLSIFIVRKTVVLLFHLHFTSHFFTLYIDYVTVQISNLNGSPIVR